MKKMAELHKEHTELSSEIAFLKQEIKFFLKILSKSYTSSSDNGRIKILDAYWKEFEKCRDLLEEVAKRIQNCELQIHTSFERNGIAKCQDDAECTLNLDNVKKNLRVLKESFYDFMIKTNHAIHEKS
jgi:hypothetical protein